MKMKQNGMYGLLAVIALMLAASIYASCSSDDDDYDNGWVELETMARGTRAGNGETGNNTVWPTASEILASPAVTAKMDELWNETVNYASAEGRREFGCFILYDPQNHTYSFEPITPGPVVNGTQHASISFNGYLNANCCAFFHTHTTLEYCNDTTFYRITGPSGSDTTQSNFRNIMPCFVYDYTLPSIKGGESKLLDAKKYIYMV